MTYPGMICPAGLVLPLFYACLYCRLDALLASLSSVGSGPATTPEMRVPSTLALSARSAVDPLVAAVTPAEEPRSVAASTPLPLSGPASSEQEHANLTTSRATPAATPCAVESFASLPSPAQSGGLARLLNRINKGAPHLESNPQPPSDTVYGRSTTSAAPWSPDSEMALSLPSVGASLAQSSPPGGLRACPAASPAPPALGRHAGAAARLQATSSPSTPTHDFPSRLDDASASPLSGPRAAAPLPFMSPAGRWRHEGGLRGASAQSDASAQSTAAMMPQTPPQPRRRGAAWMQRATAVSDSFPSGLPRSGQMRQHSAARWSWDAATGGSRPPPLLQPAAQYISARMHSGEVTPVMGPVTAPLRFSGVPAAHDLGVTPPTSSCNDSSPHALSELAHILQATPGSLVPGMSDRSPADVRGLASDLAAAPALPAEDGYTLHSEHELAGHSTLMPVPSAGGRAGNPHTRELLAALFSPGPRSMHATAGSGSRLPRPQRRSGTQSSQLHASGMPSPALSPIPCVPSCGGSPLEHEGAQAAQAPAQPSATPSRLPVARRLFSPTPRQRAARQAGPAGAPVHGAVPAAASARSRLTRRQPPATDAPPVPQPASTSRAVQPVRTASYGQQALSIAVNLLRSPPVKSARRAASARSKSARRENKHRGRTARALSQGRGPLTLEEWQATPGGIALAGGARSAPVSAHKERGGTAPMSGRQPRYRGGVPTAPSSSAAILSSLMLR